MSGSQYSDDQVTYDFLLTDNSFQRYQIYSMKVKGFATTIIYNSLERIAGLYYNERELKRLQEQENLTYLTTSKDLYMLDQKFLSNDFDGLYYLSAFYDPFIIFVLQDDQSFESVGVYSQMSGSVEKEGSIYESKSIQYSFDVAVNRESDYYWVYTGEYNKQYKTVKIKSWKVD